MTSKDIGLRIAKGARRKGPFASIEEAVEAIRTGRMVVVVDDESRENEGDLTMAASKVTPEAINFMARPGRGLICLAMTRERLDQLAIVRGAPGLPEIIKQVRSGDRRRGQHDDQPEAPQATIFPGFV